MSDETTTDESSKQREANEPSIVFCPKGVIVTHADFCDADSDEDGDFFAGCNCGAATFALIECGRKIASLEAALRRARGDTALDAARRWVKAQTLFRTASQDDRDYAAKSAELIRAEHAFYAAASLPQEQGDA